MSEIIFLRTPYYRTKSEQTAEGCLRFPQTNYQPYNLFALRTRLEPLAKKRLKLPVLIHFDSRFLDERIIVTVEFWYEGEPVKLKLSDQDFLRRAINYITGNEPDLCLLMLDEAQWVVDLPDSGLKTGQLIPIWWNKEMMLHLLFAGHFRAHHRPQLEYQLAGIYIDLNRVASYKDFYHEIYNDAVLRLNEMYQLGYLSLPINFDPDKLKRWQVNSVKPITAADKFSLQKTIFLPSWQDYRLTKPVGGMVAFLAKHLIQEVSYVTLQVGWGLIRRYQVAATFQRVFPVNAYRFRDDIVEIKSDNLMLAQKAACLIELSKTRPVGQVIVFKFPSLEWYNLYLYLLINLSPADREKHGFADLKPLGYRIDEADSTHCVSCQIPYEANGIFYQKMIKVWIENQATNRPQLENLLSSTKLLVQPVQRAVLPSSILPTADIFEQIKRWPVFTESTSVLFPPEKIALPVK